VQAFPPILELKLSHESPRGEFEPDLRGRSPVFLVILDVATEAATPEKRFMRKLLF
jgi:hypothetical protein